MIHFIQYLFHVFLNWCGASNPAGTTYGFWSGFGSDLGEVTIVVGLIAWWKAGECHVDKCHRRGKHPFKHYRLCARHHPDVPNKITHTHILKLHKNN